MADSAPAFVRELNKVLFPTLGRPTMPNFIFDDTCPEIHYMQGFLPFYIVMLYNLLHCLFDTTVFINRIISSI